MSPDMNEGRVDPDALLEGLLKLGDELPREYACFLAFDCVKAR